MIGNGMDPMRVYGLMHRGDLQRIIHAARTAGDEHLRKDATAFANALVAQGLTEFRKVLDPSYSPPSLEE
jgi:hypothetical protein